MENNFYIRNISKSQFSKFITNSGDWQNERILWNYDKKRGIAACVGIVAHKFVEAYLKTGNINDSVVHSNKCVYEGENGKVYIIDIDRFSNAEEITLELILEDFKTNIVDFGKKWSIAELRKKIEDARKYYVSEIIEYGDILAVELDIEHEVSDSIGWVNMLSPVPFKSIIDLVCRQTKDRSFQTSDWIRTYPKGTLYIEDVKFKGRFSEINTNNPNYFFQAFFNYYTLWKELGEKPEYMIFREIKISQNKDGSSQHQTVVLHFSGEDFELHKAFFWRYYLEAMERMKFIQERDFLFNIFDWQNGEKEFEKQIAYYMDVPVWELKNKMMLSERNKVASKIWAGNKKNGFITWKTKIWKMDIENVTTDTIEDKIRIKFLDYGIPLEYEKTVEWYAVNQILYKPSRWVVMKHVEGKVKEIQQITGIEEIRIEAPVPGTNYIGVEYPREKREFLPLSTYTIKKRGCLIPIGKDIAGELTEIDLSDTDNPHLVVAGKTGSGKSEFMKVVIESLKGKTDIILVDPKRVEFSKYKDISELYIYDAYKFSIFLNGDPELNYPGYIDLIDARYKMFEEEGLKDIEEYNKKHPRKKMRRKILIIDEFESVSNHGDIMSWIHRIATLGRACGIHLVIATQRPTVKVLDGQIKANISTRVCFALSSQVDSKVVLDDKWAEKLLGKWDMLFKCNGKSKRLQSFYIK